MYTPQRQGWRTSLDLGSNLLTSCMASLLRGGYRQPFLAFDCSAGTCTPVHTQAQYCTRHQETCTQEDKRHMLHNAVLLVHVFHGRHRVIEEAGGNPTESVGLAGALAI